MLAQYEVSGPTELEVLFLSHATDARMSARCSS